MACCVWIFRKWHVHGYIAASLSLSLSLCFMLYSHKMSSTYHNGNNWAVLLYPTHPQPVGASSSKSPYHGYSLGTWGCTLLEWIAQRISIHIYIYLNEVQKNKDTTVIVACQLFNTRRTRIRMPRNSTAVQNSHNWVDYISAPEKVTIGRKHCQWKIGRLWAINLRD